MNFLIYLITLLHFTNLSSTQEHESRLFGFVFGNGNDVVDGNFCNRKCVRNKAMICKFNFEVEHYHTMSRDCGDCPTNLTACSNQFCIPADGVPRAVTVVNRQLPGPSIIVCRGDQIVVDVTNKMSSDTTTIHWHGILQKDSQYNDGVPSVTQCPITPGATFRYQFKADEAGTFFYHSHSGIQRVDGVTGPLIVRESDEENRSKKLYDQDLNEHIIHVMDWDHELALSKYEGSIHWVNGSNQPYSMLVNGLGRNATYAGNTFTPTARFTVTQGQRYRFRLINSGNLDCPIQISIDNHKLTTISSDANDYQPVEVDSIMSLSGERYDFILNANQPVGVYWIKFRGYINCEDNGAHQVAVLQYQGAANNAYPPGNPTYDETNRQGLQLNPWNSRTNQPETVPLTNLRSLDLIDNVFTKKPQSTFFIPFDLNLIYNPEFRTATYPTAQINHITNQFLPFPLLSQRNSLDSSLFCTDKELADCQNKYCKCSFGLKVPLRAIVELVLINEAKSFEVNHPFHLHGFKFRVVAIEKLGNSTTLEQVQSLYNSNKIKRNLETAPLKDTVSVPPGGYTIIRFEANNPGFWLFHCHIDPHVEEGMFLVFQVGEFYQMPSVPRNFPTCGDYLPNINK